MFLELIATFVFGFAAAGVVMLLNRVTGRRLPRWLTPVAAGAAMIVFTINSEYSWYARTSAELPDGIVIVETVETRAFYRPWTYAFPYIDRFAAVDTARILRNEATPDQIIVPMYFFGRWAPVSELPIAVDCAESRRAQLADGIDFAEDGALRDVAWIDAGPSDPVVMEVCG